MEEREKAGGDYIDHGTALKTMSHMFKVSLNEESREEG